jgi:preprotein translocase subunit SecA
MNPKSRQRSTSNWPEWWHRRRWNRLVSRILELSDRFQQLAETDLRARAARCRREAPPGFSDDSRLCETHALVREVSDRVHGLRPHPAQVLCALAMSDGWIAEMRTGEGKTLASLMTIAQFALQRRGCHVFTTNEYLARRDCEFARPVLDWFGLTTAWLEEGQPDDVRRTCYTADVTYGAESAFGFDFLRDRLNELDSRHRPIHSTSNSPRLQRELHCAVIDEADSILIDQAATPLIISCPQPASAAELELLQWSETIAGTLIVEREFALDDRQRTARLTQRGCRRIRLTKKPPKVAHATGDDIYAQIERALASRHFFREQHEYLVVDCRVELIDRGTGRMLPGRKWRDGLQQAIEIRAGLSPSDSAGAAARMTLQGFFPLYQVLCGMTGTAREAQGEISRSYGLRVTSIPPHASVRLRQLPERVFSGDEVKWSAIHRAAIEHVLQQRAVLIGTSSIVATDRCAAALRSQGVDVQVLHAEHHQQEAEIVRRAGHPGRVTVATNMAGRGTDIRLHPAVLSAGGLHVILSELNFSPRLDRQLVGRAGRQGDPGSCQTFVSLDDQLLSVLGEPCVHRLRRRASGHQSEELPSRWIAWFKRAQQIWVRRATHDRAQLRKRELSRQELLKPLGLDHYVEFLID